ncbi:MAG: DUF2752 domain-containing protein [Planctomycetota bacterium]
MQEGDRVRRRAFVSAAVLGVLLMAALAMRATPEEASLAGVEGPSCALRMLFGEHSCPGCGLTRATALAAQGEAAAAWRTHPAGLLVVALLAAGLLVQLSIAVAGRSGGRHAFLIKAGRLALFAGVLGGWILKWS